MEVWGDINSDILLVVFIVKMQTQPFEKTVGDWIKKRTQIGWLPWLKCTSTDLNFFKFKIFENRVKTSIKDMSKA